MYDANESAEMVRKFLIAIGCEIQPDTNVIIDQETKSPISFEGKSIKANDDPNKGMYISEYDIKLDPLNPKCTKMIERFFGKFLDDNSSEEMQNIPEVLSYFFDKNDTDATYRLNIKFADGTTWFGNWYLNKIICYIEAIFTIDGTFDDINFRLYDVEQNQIENM